MNSMLFNEDGYKKYFVFLFIFLLIIIVSIIFILVNKKRYYFFVNESSTIVKDGFNYKQVKNIDNKYLNDEYSVYSDGKVYKNVTVKFDSNVWYYFDKDYNDLDLNKVSLLYTSSFDKLKVANYDVSYYEEADDSILSEVLGDKKISDYKDSVIKSSFDIAGDGSIETIYTISDLDLSDSNGFGSFIFLVRDNKIIKIIEKSASESFLVQNIVDIDGDGKYEIIVSKGTNDVVTFDTTIKIYSINKSRVKCIMNCKK